MFKNPFSFEGRIRRSEYVISWFTGFFANMMIFVIGSEFPFLLFGLIGTVWFVLAQGAKRCHDRGNTGVFQIIPFYILFMFFADGDRGPNQYGENPKALN